MSNNIFNSDKYFVTNGGLETDMIFNRGLELPEFAAFTLLDSEAGKAHLRDYFESYVKRFHENARLLKYRLEGYKSLKEQLQKVFISFEIEDFAITAGEKFIIFRPPGVSYDAGVVGIPKRKYPMFWGGPEHTQNRISIGYPPDYTAYYLADGESLSSKGVSFESGFQEEKGRLIYQDEYVRELEWLNPEEYSEYKELIEKRALFSKEWVVLKKNI